MLSLREAAEARERGSRPCHRSERYGNALKMKALLALAKKSTLALKQAKETRGKIKRLSKSQK